MKTIFLAFSSPLDIRNYLRSDFYNLAISDPALRLVIFIPQDQYASAKQEFSHPRCIVEAMPAMEHLNTPWWNSFHMIVSASIPTKTIHTRLRKTYLDGGSWLGYGAKYCVWLLGHTRAWRELVRAINFYFFRNDSVWKKYVDTYAPDLIFATNMRVDPDIFLLKYAKRRGIPTIGMPQSWDNFTSKLFVFTKPDVMLVHNQTMIREAEKYADMAAGRIRMVGFLQFDHYRDLSWYMTKEEVGAQLNLDSKKHWISYFTGGLPVAVLEDKDTFDHLAMLKNAAAQGILPNAEVIVKLHPINPHRFVESVARDIPVLAFGKNFDFRMSEMKTLMNFIRLSDVIIVAGSTIALEAAILDSPVVLAAFNGYHDDTVPLHRRMSYALDHTVHYLQVQQSGGVWRVGNEQELVHAVKTYLENPALHREGRARLASELGGPLDGNAGRRVFNAMREMVNASVA